MHCLFHQNSKYIDEEAKKSKKSWSIIFLNEHSHYIGVRVLYSIYWIYSSKTKSYLYNLCLILQNELWAIFITAWIQSIIWLWFIYFSLCIYNKKYLNQVYLKFFSKSGICCKTKVCTKNCVTPKFLWGLSLTENRTFSFELVKYILESQERLSLQFKSIHVYNIYSIKSESQEILIPNLS